MKITSEIKIILENIDKKFRFLKHNLKDNQLVITPLNKVLNYFNPQEKRVLKEILKLKPTYKAEFISYDVSEIKFKIFRNEVYFYKGKKIKLYPRYLPEVVANHFLKMRKCMKKEIKKKIVLASGYRSAGYQLLIFVQELVKNNFNLKKVLRKVALPGYSEHNDPRNTAIDLITEEGIPQDEKETKIFVETKEYRWLLKNAQKFKFYQSYPLNNPFFIFEPWHWRFKN